MDRSKPDFFFVTQIIFNLKEENFNLNKDAIIISGTLKM